MSSFQNEKTKWGESGWFHTTHWTQLQNAKSDDQERRKTGVNNLTNRYWKPVYCWLISKGYDSDKAEELTQGFFLEIVLGRELYQQADQTKGRFRTFLLKALDCYAKSVYRKETSKKRCPQEGIFSLDAAELVDISITKSESNPDQAFHYAWATNLLDKVLEQIKEDYCNTDRMVFWQLFEARILSPIFDNIEAPSLTELCNKYGIEGKDIEKKASNMIITVKRRFFTALRNSLRQYVQNDSEVDEEFCELINILSKGGAA